MAQETKVREEPEAAEYRVVGKPAPRIEGVGKVTGKTVYADDMKLPGMLHAKVLGSPYAHARITSIDATRPRPGRRPARGGGGGGPDQGGVRGAAPGHRPPGGDEGRRAAGALPHARRR